ncbi:MAG TPA: toll/interleukin-1 receptor domain-containing protein [Actinomycetota bacterium]|nr:toll/interleukin-1 receptor domain-containing protein [Actinomycetota bacterium]
MDWQDEHIRLFMTHISAHRRFVDEVATALADFGVHGFVAHRSIATSRPWEAEIREALRTCDALAAFLHEGYRESDWTDQEVGFCFQRQVPLIPLKFDFNPYGFLRNYQAHDCKSLEPRQVARAVFEALLDDPGIGARVVDGSIEALAQARNFNEANRRATALEAFPASSWTPDRLQKFRDAFANDQVAGGFTARKVARRIFARRPLSRPWVRELGLENP